MDSPVELLRSETSISRMKPGMAGRFIQIPFFPLSALKALPFPSWGSNPLSSSSVPLATLVIAGTPQAYGSASPLNYGTNLVPLFQLVTNQVPATVTGTNG